MKCSKCGTECKDTQTFCLCCGSQLHENQEDFMMEEELANSVGALLDEFDDEEDDIEDFEIRLGDEAEKVHKELQVENIYSNSNRRQARAAKEAEEDDWDYDEDKYFEDMQEIEQLHSSEEVEKRAGEERKTEKKSNSAANVKQKKKKKAARIAVTSVVVLMVLALTIVIGILISGYVNNNLSSFEDYRKAAVEACEEGEYKTALSHIKKAINKAENAKNAARTEDEKTDALKNMIEARIVLDDIYTKSGQLDSEYEKNLLTLVELDDSQVDAYVKLATYYEDKQPKAMTDFLRTIRDENAAVIDALKEYIIPVPQADKGSGTYTEQFIVTLTSDANTTIAYTMDGSDPSVHGVTYSEPIQIKNFRAEAVASDGKGVTVIKAIAIDARGVESKVQEFRYEIVMASAEPQVTPESGRYDDYIEIVVNVPEGSKCYYTISEDISDPANPDATSNLYIASEEEMPEGSEEEFEPLQMQRGTHTMKFVLIDEYGIVSEVAKRTYILDIEPKVTVNAAEELVVAAWKVKEENPEDETEVTTPAPEPGVPTVENTITAVYETKVLVENQEYYIFNVVEETAEGVKVAEGLVAVNSYDETVMKDVLYNEDEKQYTIPEPEEEEETEIE